jgi:periplasmic protein TonB
MTHPRLQARWCVVIAIVAAGVAMPAAQERSLGDGQRWQIAGAFPQSEPGPLERQARPVTPENPIPRRTRLVNPPYPPEAAVVGARASVTLRVVIDHLGAVAEVRTVGAPILGAVAPGSPTEEPAFTAGLLALVQSAKDAVGQWLYDPPADAPVAFNVVIGFTTQGGGEVVAQGPSSPLGPVDGAGNTGIRQATKVKHVSAVYPPAARDAGIAGVVIVEARIGPDGRVLDAHVLRSIPELDQAALDAVMQWEYVPLLVNGVPSAFTMTTTIQFSLP